MSDLQRIRPASVVGRRAPAPDPELAAVRERWPAVVGETVARHAVPARMSAGSVVVACSSSAWSSELTMLAPAIGERLRAELGRPLELRFEVGEVPAPEPPARAPLPPPAPDALRQARELVADVPSAELRASLERAISRTLRG
jgi:predicted nucleic acid-binding Zn ribbon protein